MNTSDLPVSLPPSSRLLGTADFRRLAEVPAEIEWFANIDNPQTRRAYRNALEDFMKFFLKSYSCVRFIKTISRMRFENRKCPSDPDRDNKH